MSDLDNPFLTGANPLAGLSMSESDFDLLDNADEGLRGGLDGTAGDLHMYHYVGEDGLPYRENRTWDADTQTMSVEQTDERVYLWNPSLEKKAANQDDGAREAAQSKEFRAGSKMYYTEEEIKAQWDADEGMGYLKEQTDWDTYWGLVTATTEGVANGTIPAENWQESPEYMALVQSSGIPLQYTNDDGDIYNFNGFGYSRDYKFDDSIQGEMIMGIGLGLIGAFAAGPLIAGALQGAGLSASAATAMSKGIVSAASQYMSTGEVDLGQALLSAAGSYGMDKVQALEGSLGGILDTVNEATDKFTDFITQGNSIAEAALNAGGMSMLTQLVMNGEVDATEAGIAALMAGGTQAFSEYAKSITDLGGEEPVLEEIVVDARRKGEDLGNGMTNYEGMVFNSDNELVGYMDDIDLNSDGVLDSNDLQNITTPPRDLADPTYEGSGNVYGDVDSNISVPEDTDQYAYGGTHPDTTIAYDENGNPYVSRRDVFWKDGDDQSLYFEDGTVAATNNGDGTWTFGDDENAPVGKLSEFGFESDSGPLDFEQQADELRLPNTEQVIYDAESNSFKGTGTSGDQGIATPIGEQDHDYWLVRDENGAIYVTDGYKMEPYRGGISDDPNFNDGVENYFRSKDPIWQHVSNGGSLPDGSAPDGYFADIVVPETSEEIPPPEEPVEQPSEDDSSANADPNDNVDAGEGDSGGGATNSTGGAGDSGQSGGGGETGAGDTAGSVNPDFTLPPWLNEFLDSIDAGTDSEVPIDDDGEGLGGAGGTTGGTDDGDGTGGTGGGSESGAGDDAGPDVGAGTGTGEGGSGGGSGDSGDTAGGTGTGGGLGNEGGSGTGTGGGQNDGNGTGGSVGVGVGSGTEPGAGSGAGGGGNGGNGNGNGSGMMSGHNPSWGELFDYTPFDVYKPGKGLEPIQGLLKGYL